MPPIEGSEGNAIVGMSMVLAAMLDKQVVLVDILREIYRHQTAGDLYPGPLGRGLTERIRQAIGEEQR